MSVPTFTNKEMEDIIRAADSGSDGSALPLELRHRFKRYCKAYNFPYPFKEIM